MLFQTSRPERMSYVSFFLGQNIMYMGIMMFLTMYYTDVAGLDPLKVGTLFLVARLWDAINDPILGVIVDRTNFKGGKFLPWIRTSSLFLPLIFTLLFFADSFGGSALIYAYVTYIAFGMLYTLSDVPIFALATVMSSNNEEQTKLIMSGKMAASIAIIIVMIGFTVLSTAIGYTLTSVIFAVLVFLMMIPLTFLAKERVQHTRTETTKISDIFKFLASDKNIIIFYVSLIFMTGFNVANVLGTYIAKYNFDNPNSLMLITLLPMIFLIPLIGFSAPLIKKFGKKNITVVGLSISSILSVFCWLVGYDNLMLFVVLNLFRMLFMMVPLMFGSLYAADFVEVSHSITGKRQEGISFSAQTFSSKSISALSGFFGTVVLNWSALNLGEEMTKADQTVASLDKLWAGYNLFPVIGLVVGILLMFFFYTLNERDVDAMRKANK